MRIALSLFAFLLGACSGPAPDPALSDNELQEVRSVIQAYADAWVAGDSSAVLALFTEDATISPSGLSPKSGKPALREFWFPNDGSSVTVPAYTIEVIDAGGAGDIAYTSERTSLSYTFAQGGKNIQRATKAYATTLYRRGFDGRWRIFRRMWTDTLPEQ